MAVAGLVAMLDQEFDDARKAALLGALGAGPLPAHGEVLVEDMARAATSTSTLAPAAALAWARISVSASGELALSLLARTAVRVPDPGLALKAMVELSGLGGGSIQGPEGKAWSARVGARVLEVDALRGARHDRARRDDAPGDLPRATRGRARRSGRQDPGRPLSSTGTATNGVARCALATPDEVKAAKEKVLAALKDPIEEIRVAAALALRLAGDGSGADILLASIADPVEGPEVRGPRCRSSRATIAGPIGGRVGGVRAAREVRSDAASSPSVPCPRDRARPRLRGARRRVVPRVPVRAVDDAVAAGARPPLVEAAKAKRARLAKVLEATDDARGALALVPRPRAALADWYGGLPDVGVGTARRGEGAARVDVRRSGKRGNDAIPLLDAALVDEPAQHAPAGLPRRGEAPDGRPRGRDGRVARRAEGRRARRSGAALGQAPGLRPAPRTREGPAGRAAAVRDRRRAGARAPPAARRRGGALRLARLRRADGPPRRGPRRPPAGRGGAARRGRGPGPGPRGRPRAARPQGPGGRARRPRASRRRPTTSRRRSTSSPQRSGWGRCPAWTGTRCRRR